MGRTKRWPGTVFVGILALAFAGCAPMPAGESLPSETSSAAPDLSDRLLSVAEVPLAGWEISGKQTLPAVMPSPTPVTTISTGTSTPVSAPRSLCGDGELNALPELAEAVGIEQRYQVAADPRDYFTESLYEDPDGVLASAVENALKDCQAAGPVSRELTYVTQLFSWTEVDATPAEGIFTTQFGRVDVTSPKSLTVSVGHVDGTTMVSWSPTQQVWPLVSLEDHLALTNAAYASLSR